MPTFDYPPGATPLDPDEAEGLLPTHITTQGELNRLEQDNILDAIDWLEATAPADILDEGFARKLHERMFGDVWTWAGSFRRSDKNIGGPWHQIPMRLADLFADVRVWIESDDDPDEIAARFHHRLVSIHPFPNGNGRHARLMTDVLVQNVLKRPRFSWGSRDLTGAGEDRSAYIAALQAADQCDIGPLLEFVRS